VANKIPIRPILAWLMVLLNLAPIGWMIWCSLMGNNEILQGKLLPDRQRNDVFFVEEQGNHLWAGTVNGQLYQYDLENPSQTPRLLDLGQVSTRWLRKDSSIWVFSADGALSQLDPHSLTVQKNYDWDWMEANYRQLDPTPFVQLPGDSGSEFLSQLATRFNSHPLNFEEDGKSLSKIAGQYFPTGSALVDTLNQFLKDSVKLNAALFEWQKHGDWFNPIIPWLFQQQRTSVQDRLLFRWCLAERFPSPATRFLDSQWNSVWVNRIPGSGYGTSLSSCGADRICFALWWDEFPGIGVLSLRDGSLHWITLQHGLPSTAIQHLVSIDENRLVVVSDEGLSLVHVAEKRVLRNALYGEKGLKYLDGRDVRTAVLDSAHVLLAYGQELVSYNVDNGLVTSISLDRLDLGSSDITALSYKSGMIYLGSSEGVLRLPIDSSFQATPIQGVFRHDDSLRRDEVVHTIQLQNEHLVLGGLLGLISRMDLQGRPLWNAQVPEGRLELHWRNYEDLWKTIPFGVFLRNSLLIASSVMLISIVIAALASYALVRFEFPGKRIFNGLILSTQMVPGILYLIPIFILFTAVQQIFLLPLVNTWHGIVLVYSAFFIPMSIWILRGYFASIPRELEEAAMIDGCSPWGAFWKIAVPVAFPGIVATGIYVFLLAWDELLFAWVLSTDLTTATIPVGIRLYVGQFGNRFDLLMAAATVASLPVMFLFFLMQRHIVSGLTGGAVKG